MGKTQVRNSFLLFLAAFIWGVAFVSQSKGMEYMGPMTFNGVRSIIGVIALLPLVLYRTSMQKKENRTRESSGLEKNIGAGLDSKCTWRFKLLGGLCCGLALTTAGLLQQFGILYTSVGKAGFITTLYIIFVPILGIFLRRKIAPIVWGCAALAAFGMYLLCMTGSFSLGIGDSLVFICAIVFAVHILVVEYFGAKIDGVLLSMLQFAVCAIISMMGAFLFEEPRISEILMGYIPLLYAGVFSSGIAYTLQIVGQKDMNPTIAALIMSLESVISALAGYVAYKAGFLGTDQTLSVRQIIGCIIVFIAVIIVQLPIRSTKKEEA